ncbi:MULTISPECIES: ATP-binding protein [unclassified Rhizobium]|uniref:ATP-binding protein n=1 Tax=unclassified Rhizobium TaxID=2613769 RepID=UPI001FDF8FAE|nr:MULTISPECIES: ATP-binding protein [unclassified Rhizobium]
MIKRLNGYIVKAMLIVALIAFIVTYLGITIYYVWVEQWLYPDIIDETKWQISDFVLIGIILAIGLVVASIAGWRLTKTIVEPLEAVASAARAIAEGDFTARAPKVRPAFHEAHALVEDFNSMAERLSKAEAELKYSNSSIAHELRTPLTILRGRLQGLLDGTFEPSSDLYVRLIAHVDDLSTIVEELRTLALSSAGKLDLELDTVDLAREVRGILESIAEELRRAGITLDGYFAPAVSMADRTKIRQAVLALLENCRRYAPGSKVELHTGQKLDYVFIRIADNGPGLKDMGRERAFERFWRADESRTRALGGSGLGLSVVRGIAIAHGGEALIVDQQGPGLAIEIRLPLKHVQA